MIFTMVPGEAWAAKGAADLQSTGKADGKVNVANLESQLWALDKTTEQRDLIYAHAKSLLQLG